MVVGHARFELFFLSLNLKHLINVILVRRVNFCEIHYFIHFHHIPFCEYKTFALEPNQNDQTRMLV